MTPLIFLFVVMLAAGPGLLFGYRTLRQKDRAAAGKTILYGFLTIVVTMILSGVALWVADDAAVTAEERTATLTKASSALHGPLRFGVGIGSVLCLWGAGGWCLLVMKDLYAYLTLRAPEAPEAEERDERVEAPYHRWSVKLRAGVDEAGVQVVLDEIIERFGTFEVYDVHYTSPSDPGAYMSYARYDSENRQWQMTLGNHGWTGGIYFIAHSVVVRQLLHLANSTGEVELMSDAMFFSHYQPEPPRKNEQMNAKLIAIHGGTPI